MLTQHRLLLGATAVTSLALAACTSSQEAAPPPETTTTTTTTAAPVEQPTTIRVGIAVNESAPTAAFDAKIEAILTEAAEAVTTDTGIEIDLRPVSVDSPGQAEGTMAAFINDGVSVVITGCDDATVPAVVEAATANELLALTGCVALPRPDLDGLRSEIDTDLFIDLSGLDDNAEAISNFAASEGFSSIGVVQSTLFPDVEQTCVDLQNQLPTTDDAAPDSVGVTAQVLFAELIDNPADVVGDLGVLIGDEPLDAIVVCALPPTVGDVVAELRAAGIDSPVILPWFGDSQVWSEDTNDVFIVTPASRYGDDPEDRVSSLFEALAVDGGDASAVDVVTADTLAVLANAAARSGSVGSRRLADAIRDSSTTRGISGELNTGGSEASPVQRIYRVIQVEDGTPSFRS